MSEENGRPNIFRRVGRGLYTVLKMTLITLLLIVIIVGIGWLIYLGVSEANRSFSGIHQRIDANNQRAELLRDDITALQSDEAAQRQEVDQLQTALVEQTALAAALQAELTVLSGDVVILEGNVDTAMATGETAIADTTNLADALLALQADINDSNGRLDGLGGEVDELRAEIERLDTAVRPLADTVADGESSVSNMEQTVILFHIWNLLDRARQGLSAGNAGLAAADMELVLRIIDMLPVEEIEGLKQTKSRMELALSALPDDPQTAVRDLDTTWNALNALLLRRLTAELDLAIETAVPEPTPTPASP